MVDEPSPDDDTIPYDFSISTSSSFTSPFSNATDRSLPSTESSRRLNDLNFRKAQQRPRGPNVPPANRNHRVAVRTGKRRKSAQQDETEGQHVVSAWLATRLVAGIRGDPFNSLPIEPKDCVPRAVDSFIQVYIPERILRPFQAVPGIERLAQEYFRLVIGDVGMFEATVAQMEANSAVMSGVRKPTKEVMLHHGHALDHLQRRLADPERRLEDLTFHIIISIMSTHFFFSELEQHKAHLDGLWVLVNMRGGIDTLGWDGSLKQTIETVTSFVNYQTKTQSPAASPEAAPTVESGPKLDYPTHPFPTELSLTISKLPPGFADIAMNRTLSIQSIDLLADVQDQDLASRAQDQGKPPPPNRRRLYTADKCLQLLKSTSMPELERMIIGGLLAYTIQSQPASTRTTVYDESLMSFLAELAQYTFFNYEHASLLWIVMCFATLQDHLTQGARVDFFHHTVLRFRQSARWSRMEASLKEFLWTEERLSEWKWAWADAIGSHRPMGYESRTPSKSPETESVATMSVAAALSPVSGTGKGRSDAEMGGLQIKIEE